MSHFLLSIKIASDVAKKCINKPKFTLHHTCTKVVFWAHQTRMRPWKRPRTRTGDYILTRECSCILQNEMEDMAGEKYAWADTMCCSCDLDPKKWPKPDWWITVAEGLWHISLKYFFALRISFINYIWTILKDDIVGKKCGLKSWKQKTSVVK